MSSLNNYGSKHMKKLLILSPFLALLIFFAYKNLNQGMQEQVMSDLSQKIFFTPTDCNFSKITANITEDNVIIKGELRVREASCMKLIPTYEIKNGTLILNIRAGRVKFGLECKDRSAYPVCYEAKINLKNLKRIIILHNGRFEKEVNISE